MLDYLLALLLAPLLRRLIGCCLKLMVIALVVTTPARLWLRYEEARPSEETLMALNAANIILLSGIFAIRSFRRRR